MIRENLGVIETNCDVVIVMEESEKKTLTFIISIKTLKYAVFQAFILNDLDLHNELGTCQLTFNSDETIRQKLCVFITM